MTVDASIYSILNVSAVTSALGASTNIFNDLIIPNSCTTSPVINYYRVSTETLSNCYVESLYNINCRAVDFGVSDGLALIVSNLFNNVGKTISSVNYKYTAYILPTISPSSSGDFYNTPVQVRVKSIRRFEDG